MAKLPKRACTHMNLAEKARSPRRTGTSMDSLREGVGAPWMWPTTGGGSTGCKPRAAAAAAASLAHPPQVQVLTTARDAEPAAECASFHSTTRQHPDLLLLAEQRLDSANLPDAVGALERAADSGRRVPKHLLYRLLKRCSSSSSISGTREEEQEEQVVARVQRLAERCGYRGDPFLATHLIGAYGARGLVDRAAQVFAQVAAPDRYNWAAILLAHARHGGAAQAAEAVRLYRRMREQGAVRPDARVFVGVIKACAAVGDVGVGREVHAAWAAAGVSSNGCSRDAKFVQAALVSMYAKCGDLEAAREVFDQASAGDRDVVMWNAMLAGYAQHGSDGAAREAIRLYDRMVSQATGTTTTTRSIAPNSVTYVCVLQACASVGALVDGRRVHAHIRQRRALDDVVAVGGSLVNMYAKCGSLDEARGVLDALPARNVVAWTALLAGYAQRGMGEAALALYGRMRREGGPEAAPDAVTFVCLLQACASLGAAGLARGRAVHAHVVEQDEQVEAEVGCSLVHMYVKCGSLADARSVLDKLLILNRRKQDDDGASSSNKTSSGGVVAAWNAMLAGYAQHGMGAAAMALYHDVAPELVPDAVTLVSAVQACAAGVGPGDGRGGGGGWSAEDALRHGRRLHAQARKLMLLEATNSSSSTNLGSSLVDMYAKCGSLGDARAVFDALPSKDPATWAAMLGACAAAGVDALSEGRRLHAQLVAAEGLIGGVVAASLVNMYARCGRVQDARAVFDGVPPAERTVAAWNAMVAGYVRAGEPAAALALYRAMVSDSTGPAPSPVTYVCALAACAGVGVAAAEDGERIHARIRREGLELSQGEGGDLATSLVNMYAKCGRVDVARAVWDAVPPEERTTPVCNAMLAGYAHHGMGQQALALYRDLTVQQGGAAGGGEFVPDAVTCVCLLQACAAAGALPLARTLHARLLASDTGGSHQHHPAVATALVSAYAKLGSMPDAHRAAVAAAPPGHAAEAWGALAAGYARHGDLPAAAAAVRRMEASSSLAHPDPAAALALLTARAHSRAAAPAGAEEHPPQPPLVTDDLDLDLLPAQHAACAVDLAARAGRLDDALQLARTLPPAADASAAWRALLGACRAAGGTPGSVKVGEAAFAAAVAADPRHPAAYVLMAEVYAAAGMAAAAAGVQARRRRAGASKEPGRSWCADEEGVVHTFVAGGVLGK